MRNYIIVGCDMSDENLVLRCAHNEEKPETRRFRNDVEGRVRMVRYLEERAQAAGGAKVVFAYEAGPHGFGLCDELTARGIECHALAPTKLASSSKSRKNKTDEKDAHRIFEALRGHLLAGNDLPSVWVPDEQTRDDRELVRSRLDAVDKRRRIHSQIKMLLKRYELRRPKEVGQSWTRMSLSWLRGLTGVPSPLKSGARVALAALLRQLAAMEAEVKQLDEAVAQLAQEERYRVLAQAVDEEMGVGLTTAMVFLTEMGAPDRFENRRKVAAYFGLVPSSNETGKQDDRKGHITRQGNRRIRWALCQAEWAAIRSNPEEKARHERLVQRNPKRRKIATVAGMRRLGIRLWQRARIAQGGAARTPPSRPPEGGKRQFALPAQPRKYKGRPSRKEERPIAV